MPRAFDALLAALGLIVLSPLLLLTAVLVWLSSPGPILFRQHRLGQNGQRFRILKFRTMLVGAEDIRNPDGSAYTGDDDPRVTAIGHWLRRTSLDELPQLLNVLSGDMSLVGPRPDLPDQIRLYSDLDLRKLEVRPGLTGLAQISGRNALSWADRRALDVQYVERRTFLFDIGILVRTVPLVLSRRNVVTSPALTASNRRAS